MAYHIEIKRSARKELEALPLAWRRRADERILRLADDPRPPGSRKLAGPDDLYRVRAGDLRILYAIFDERLVVLVVKVGNRREVYR